MKQDTLKKGITYLFTFFIAFFLFFMAWLTAVRFTMMDQRYFLNRMEEVAYYDNTATELNRIIKQQARSAGFEVDTFEGFVKEEDLREAMISYEKQMMSGTKTSVDTKAFKEKMEKQISSYAAEKGIVINTSVQNALDQFVKECVSKYSYLTQFPYIDVYGQVMRLFQKAYIIALPILLILTGVLTMLQHRMYRSKQKRKRFDAIALIGAGLLTGTGPAFLYAARFFEKINLSPEYMYDLLVANARRLLLITMMAGLVMVLAGVLLAYGKLKRNKKTKGKSDRRYPTNEMLSQMKQEQ